MPVKILKTEHNGGFWTFEDQNHFFLTYEGHLLSPNGVEIGSAV